MGRRWQVFSLGGVPIHVTPGWLLFVGVIAWFSYTDFRQQFGLTGVVSDQETIGLTALATVLFFSSVAVHESAHAVVARSIGLPVYGVTFVFWGGFTETPAAAKGPLRAFLVAIVGPLSTLTIALLFFIVADVTSGPTSFAIGRLATLNLFFAGVNAIPAMPLDGGHALTAALRGLTGSRRTAEKVSGYVSIVVGGALVAGGFIVLRDGRSGWWLPMLFIGAQMIAMGRGAGARLLIKDRLARGTVRDAMRPPPGTIPAGMSLSEALDRSLRSGPDRPFPVTDGERLVGSISLASARKLGSKDPLRTVRDAMTPIDHVVTIDPGIPLDEAVELLSGREAMVVADGRLIGAFGSQDVDAWLRGERPRVGVGAISLPPRPDL